MKQTRTLCDCCGKEMKESEMNSPDISILVKKDSGFGDTKRVPVNITVSGFDICNSCLFMAIDNSRVTAKDSTR